MEGRGPKVGWVCAVALICAACSAPPEAAPAITSDLGSGWPETIDIIDEVGSASDVLEVAGEVLVSCVDDGDCEELDDDDLCNGLVLCLDGECQIDPTTVVECAPWKDQCEGEVCEPESGKCVATLAPPGSECDDGDLCSIDDQCVAGVCSSLEFMNCDDGNPCTADNCYEGDCASEAVEVSCEDGNPCTTGDLCVDGECASGSDLLDCDDTNPCTDDACSSVEGCIHQPNQKACEDGDPCTLGDQCIFGECKTGPGFMDCNDGNLCTTEECVAMEGCVVVQSEAACDDNDPCTEDSCDLEIGECTYSTSTCANLCLTPTADLSGTECGCLPIVCQDEDPCTMDGCQPDSGCVFAPKLCDDLNPCTVDNCHTESGDCQHVPIVCNDDNPCTADGCDQQNGECLFDGPALDGTSCSDENECTEPDHCLAGACTSGPDVCEEICGNGVDDDGNGDIDCADDACAEAENCQEQECLVTAPLQCGFVVMNSLPGEGTGNLDGYPCSPHAYPGLERVYSFVSPCAGEVSFTVSGGMMGGINSLYDVMVLEEATGCKATSCLAAGLMAGDFIKQAKVTFQAEQGKSYFMVVEGRGGDVGNFTMTSICSCIWGGN
jgi:hypothetical protein